MTKKERFNLIFPVLQERYGTPKCALDYETPYQLMIAVILSAQCTDARVNIVTKKLFEVVKMPEDIYKMDIETLEKYIKSTGFYRNKAKNIKLNAEQLLTEYNGEIPKKMEQLVNLAGVGRKTANVILGEIWGIREGIVVDTHVKRLSKRMGLTKSDNPEIIERELMKVVPKKYWFEFSHYLILYGREVSTAINPKCDICIINKHFNYCEKEKAEKQRKKVAKKK
ncbi:endonuclease III [Leptotrichia sp. OH3620_COT-345]|uniref:endonuclease III n=1 Tax=Leptotrichia sp. OH3620_COT-345 TaxID=2491048 RepID=UPI000F6483B3|nr:endonuclease III [Leptotrichia sp. OH3620_COT-345]RRD40273.1 endonuclease III [Leptotrichia sp. OH3620_COT-345]